MLAIIFLAISTLLSLTIGVFLILPVFPFFFPEKKIGIVVRYHLRNSIQLYIAMAIVVAMLVTANNDGAVYQAFSVYGKQVQDIFNDFVPFMKGFLWLVTPFAVLNAILAIVNEHLRRKIEEKKSV